MRDALWLNLRVLLRFYSRDRLLLAFGLLMAVVFGLGFVPAFVFGTATARFETLHHIAQTLNAFAFVFVPALGLIAVSSHLRGRTLKLVVTKPCPPEVWLAAVFGSATLVAFAIHAVIALATAGLSLWWSIPYQTGFLFLAIEGFFQSIVVLSFLIVLATVLHPVVAVLTSLLFTESLASSLRVLLAGSQAGSHRAWLVPVQWSCDALYAVLPLYDPIGEKTSALHRSLRTVPHDWLLLLLLAAYAFTAAVFSFTVASIALRRRNLA